tara:strand:+ start:10165 stop:10638 length:474 start_codon:yes stop_codon:yes gene_type:complete
MLNLLNKRKTQIAMTLVLAFSSIFVCDALCDVSVIEFSSSHNHGQDQEHYQPGGDDHNQPVATDSHHGQPTDHDHGDSADDNCCEDITTPFFDELIKNKVESFEFNKVEKINFIKHYSGHISFLYNSRKISTLFLYSKLPPPISGDQIRIRYQSFLL